MNRRAAPLALAAAALATLAVSGYAMARRIADFHTSHARPFYAFQVLDTREFTYAGRPVSLTDTAENGAPVLDVRYGDDELRLRVTIPGRYPLPGLAVHGDWLKVLRFADSKGLTFEQLQKQIDAGETRDRLAIVTKTPHPGADPQTWGASDRSGWVFDFYELRKEGGFEHEQKRFPLSERARKRLGFSAPAADELRPYTWEYQAALYLMPKGPEVEVKESALPAVGWTLPAAGFSGAALAGAIIWAAIRKR